ncbi:MAG TPA: tRNA lysidine(34) synthetase TilS [Bryobacteraceae bacterium]|nr:tRNA lysidine(34) synthetase TilS [Bryobacteraceae bacterium]
MWSLRDLLDRFAEILRVRQMVRSGDRIGVAVSGGADSVALLHLSTRVAPEFGIEIVAVHVNHHLRGTESDADEVFVRELAARLSVDLLRDDADVSDLHGNLEQAARDARRSIFGSLVARMSVDRIATGHTLSDQAETVLFRLFRGTGVTGLAGMRAVSGDGPLRPLLFFTREEIREWLRTNDLAWREDSSNADTRFRRNYLRHELIPRIRTELNPNLERVLAGIAFRAQAEEDYWHDVIEPLFSRFAKPFERGILGDVLFLQDQHLAVRRRLLRRACQAVKGNLRALDGSHIDALLALCASVEGNNRLLIPGVDALRSYGKIRLAPPLGPNDQKRHYRVPIRPGINTELPFNAGSIRLDLIQELPETQSFYVNVKGETGYIETAELSVEAIGGLAGLDDLIVRNWEPGDEYRRAGHLNSHKIKALFQQEKVFLWERRHWPILEFNGEIVWGRRFGPAHQFAARSSSGPLLLLRYRMACESNSAI